MQADALFVHDADNRLVRVNEPDPDGPAPRFFLIRTTSGNVWRTRYDLPAEINADLGRLAEVEPVSRELRELREPPYRLVEYTAVLEEHAPLISVETGPAYYLPELYPLVSRPADTVTITPSD